MNWRVKALMQKLLWRLPDGVRMNAILSQAASGHDPQVELLQKHLPTFIRHWEAFRRAGYAAKTPDVVLEIGTGWDLDNALLMSLGGVRTVITVDLFRHVRFRQAHRGLSLSKTLIPQIAVLAGRTASAVEEDWKRLIKATSLDNLCDLGRIHYLAPISADYREIENSSVDVCFSTAVFEHIRPEEIRRIFKLTRSKLKPGALSSHVIDLKDHFAYFQKNLPYNNFLRYSRRTWEWWADNPMSYLNRLSPTDWRKIVHETGYEIASFQTTEEPTLPGLHRELIHREQQHRSAEDLKIGEIHLVARRG